MATQEKDLEDKIIKYFTALECLLVPEHEGLKGDVLAERISILWTSSEESRRRVSQIIYDPDEDSGLYKKRSNVIHGSEYEVSEKDVSVLDYITRNIIAIISEEVSKRGFTRINQLIEWIDNQKAIRSTSTSEL